jgi:hypothetical protein
VTTTSDLQDRSGCRQLVRLKRVEPLSTVTGSCRSKVSAPRRHRGCLCQSSSRRNLPPSPCRVGQYGILDCFPDLTSLPGETCLPARRDRVYRPGVIYYFLTLPAVFSGKGTAFPPSPQRQHRPHPNQRERELDKIIRIDSPSFHGEQMLPATDAPHAKTPALFNNNTISFDDPLTPRLRLSLRGGR